MTERRQGHSKIVWDRNTSSFTTVDPHPIKKPATEGKRPLKCPGVGRDAENEQSLCFYFNRKVTDDEMRYLHEVMQRAVAILR
jgi:hypothetical protein